MIKIAIDAMGGDFAPEQQVKGAIEALGKSGDFSVILAGDEAALKAELSKYKYDSSRVEIVHAPEAPQRGKSGRSGILGSHGRGAYGRGARSGAH